MSASTISREENFLCVGNRPPNTLLGLRPFRAAQPADAGGTALPANIAGNAVCLVDGDIQDVIVLVLDGQVFALNAVDGGAEQANKLPDAVVNVHHPIPRLQVPEHKFRRFRDDWRAPADLRATPPEDFAVSQKIVNLAAVPLQHPSA